MTCQEALSEKVCALSGLSFLCMPCCGMLLSIYPSHTQPSAVWGKFVSPFACSWLCPSPGVKCWCLLHRHKAQWTLSLSDGLKADYSVMCVYA